MSKLSREEQVIVHTQVATFLRSGVNPQWSRAQGEFSEWKCYLIAGLPQKINTGGVQEQRRPLLGNHGEIL